MNTPWREELSWWTAAQYYARGSFRNPKNEEVAVWADSVEERLKKLEEPKTVMAALLQQAEESGDALHARIMYLREQHHREALESAAKMLDQMSSCSHGLIATAYEHAAEVLRTHEVQP